MDNKNINIAFVMLNYGAFDVTTKCVDSLIEKVEGEYIIVIVDNGSADKSGQKLFDEYINSSKIKVLLNKENLGFSKGLNVGYQYAKKQGYDWIALINNDTKLLSKNICSILIEDYEKYNFAVLGPHIDNPEPENWNQNPNHKVEKNDDEMRELLVKTIRRLKINIRMADFNVLNIYLDIKKGIADLYHKIIPRKQNVLGNNDEAENERKQQVFNCGLHGSYMIFSPIYTNKFDGLEPVTFAYMEEWLLYRNCKKHGLLMMYEPRIQIWHDEHTVEKKYSNHDMKRYIFRAKMELDAAQNVLKYIDKI